LYKGDFDAELEAKVVTKQKWLKLKSSKDQSSKAQKIKTQKKAQKKVSDQLRTPFPSLPKV